uniref:RING-type E3 ubiquitin transferase n=1 Tax=Haplochromis burtoni TaxID=8153 RepID=A0A3Q2V7L3_HAPBU
MPSYFFEKSEKDLSCPVCHDIYRDPVILSCSHSFCKNCLQTWWTKKQKKNCPLCKKINLSNDPPRNLVPLYLNIDFENISKV